MAQSKAIPKERYTRQRRKREVRRSLAAITPQNSNPQAQCPLFTRLPAEIRLIIFQFVLSQQLNLARPFNVEQLNPLWRPGHTHHTILDYRLLLTCRLVYYEARYIPLRSATQHIAFYGTEPGPKEDLWLHHVTKQTGAELYHLHDSFGVLGLGNFSDFLLPHLHWKKITWTIWGSFIVPNWDNQERVDWLAQTIADLWFPASCQEVNLEVEACQYYRGTWPDMRRCVEECRNVALTRVDGTQLHFDSSHALHYEWHDRRSSWKWHEHRTGQPNDGPNLLHITTRLCWRAAVPRREYMSYDRMDCLRIDDCADIVKHSTDIDQPLVGLKLMELFN